MMLTETPNHQEQPVYFTAHQAYYEKGFGLKGMNWLPFICRLLRLMDTPERFCYHFKKRETTMQRQCYLHCMRAPIA